MTLHTPLEAAVSASAMVPRVLPPPAHCNRCGAPTPDDWARMRHDTLHTPRFEHEDL